MKNPFLSKQKDLKLEEKFFDKNFYRKTNPLLIKVRNAFNHYHTVGWKEGRDPCKWFSSQKYLNENRDVLEAGMDPFYHFLAFGMKEGRRAYASDIQSKIDNDSKNNSCYDSTYEIKDLVPQAVRDKVDQEFYRKHYKDLVKVKDLGLHYFLYGWKEGRDPNRNFSTDLFFLENNLTKEELCPLIISDDNPEYKIFPSRLEINFLEDDINNLKIDVPEIELCKKYFDYEYYKQNYSIDVDALVHYYIEGYKANYNPNSWFDTGEYYKRHPNLQNGNINPLYHYLKEGYKSDCLVSKVEKGIYELHRGMPLSTSSVISCYSQYINKSPVIKKITKQFFDPKHLRINWIIPDFTQGGGGHMTIFRAIRFLELKGHSCKVWIVGNSVHASKDSAYNDIIKYYQTIKADVDFLTFENFPKDGDAIVATSWDTVEWAKKIRQDHVLFYFVQDLEKLFYSRGSKSILAEMTYKENINCICASPWLEGIMKSQYGRNAYSFLLGYNASEYFIKSEQNKFSKFDDKKHIAVYSRIFTERRAVELTLIALHILAERRSDFVVHFFGGGLNLPVAPFDYVIHGTLSVDKLNDLYNSCDIGLCFSATNYSLVPQEMMASGLPLIELDGENTRTIFPKGTISLADPYPNNIAHTIENMLDNEKQCMIQANVAKAWVDQISWDKSLDGVNAFIETTIHNEFSAKGINSLYTDVLHNCETDEFVATVVIPIYNPDIRFKSVLERVCSQLTLWDYEVILIDSSTKRCEWIDDYTQISNKIRYKKIHPSEFQHGRTRNLGVELSRGQYVAFITQDALPYDNYWLYNLVTVLSKYDDVAIAFGKHYPYPEATSFVKRDISNHFNNILNYPLVLGRDTDKEKYSKRDESWMQILHFYSDNNSCLKKEYWKKVPMRNVDYGEDQLLALDMIDAGYKKIYVPSAGVYHSHNFNENQTFERSKIEKNFFKEFFGYDLIKDYNNYQELETLLNKMDSEYAKSIQLDQSELRNQYLVNRGRAMGYFGLNPN